MSSADFYLKRGATNSWVTPLEVTRALGHFDTDPACADPQPWHHADVNYTERDDGLAQPWRGRVWLNPPYAPALITRFSTKMVEHGNGIMLVFPRTDTRWFQLLARSCDAMFLRAGRLQFCRQDGTVGGAFLGSVFFAFGKKNVRALARAKFPGVMFMRP